MILEDLLNTKKQLKTKKTATKDSTYIHQNKLRKTFFLHNMAYRYFKDLPRRTASHKLLYDKAFDIAKNPRMMDKKKVLLQ